MARDPKIVRFPLNRIVRWPTMRRGERACALCGVPEDPWEVLINVEIALHRGGSASAFWCTACVAEHDDAYNN